MNTVASQLVVSADTYENPSASVIEPGGWRGHHADRDLVAPKRIGTFVCGET